MKDINQNLIYSKIPAIMAKVGVVGKNKTNQMQGYKFRGIDDMYNALNKHLSEEGVFVTSEVLSSDREERTSKNGGVLIYTILTMKFRFYAEDGSYVESTTEGEAMDSGDKSANKAMSTAYKYALMQIFCIPTEEEKDTENNSPEPMPNNRQKSSSSTPRTNGKIEGLLSEVDDVNDGDIVTVNGIGYIAKKGISKKGEPYFALQHPTEKAKSGKWAGKPKMEFGDVALQLLQQAREESEDMNEDFDKWLEKEEAKK